MHITPDPWWNTPAVARFIARAREYCALIEGSAERPREALAHDLHRLLPVLYAAALELPEAPEAHFEDTDADERAERHREKALAASEKRALLVRLSAQFGPSWDKYRDVTDAYDIAATESDHGWLSDDLTDTFAELAQGLAAWDAGYQGQAVWELRFGFERHWGQHVLGALAAIRTLAERYGLGFPPQLPSHDSSAPR